MVNNICIRPPTGIRIGVLWPKFVSTSPFVHRTVPEYLSKAIIRESFSTSMAQTISTVSWKRIGLVPIAVSKVQGTISSPGDLPLRINRDDHR